MEKEESITKFYISIAKINKRNELVKQTNSMVNIYIGSLKEKELASKAEKICGENLHRQLNKKILH